MGLPKTYLIMLA